MGGCLPSIVPTGPEVGRASRLQDLPDAGGGPLVVCSLPFVRSLLLCSRYVGLKYALFRVLRGFLARFGGFVWVCVVLVV